MATDFAKQAPPIKNTQAVRVANKMGKRYSLLDAALAGKKIGIKWQNESFTVGDLLVGMHYELEHGKVDPDTNVTNDNKIKTAKIAWAHLKERPDYYTQLMKIDPPKAPKTEKTAFEVLDELTKEANLKMGLSNMAMSAKLNAQMAGMRMRMLPMTMRAKHYAKKQEKAKSNQNADQQGGQNSEQTKNELQKSV